MNPEIQTKWVQALRSGEYQQTQGRLKRRDSFCCLGVLCDLYIKENKNARWVGDLFDGVEKSQIYVLGPEVIKWAGIDGTCNPRISEKLITLSEINDEGTTFPVIADLIEQGKVDL